MIFVFLFPFNFKKISFCSIYNWVTAIELCAMTVKQIETLSESVYVQVNMLCDIIV